MPAVKPVQLDLGEGKPRLLKMSVDGMMLIEKELGKSISELISVPYSATVAMLLLWAELVWQDESLTLKDVKRIYEDYHDRTSETFYGFKDKLAEALFAALIKQETNGNGKPPDPNV